MNLKKNLKKNILKLMCVLTIFLLFFTGTILMGGVVQKNNSNSEATEPEEISTSDKNKQESTEKTMDNKNKENSSLPQSTQPRPTDEIATESVAIITQATELVTESVTESTEVDDSQQPYALTVQLSEGGISYDSLRQTGCRQLIVVTSYGSDASISMFEMQSDGLWKNNGLETSGYVGQGGASYESYEGSRETPAGFFSIGDAFYIDSVPETNLHSFHITDSTYWVDDPSSKYYNQRVEGTADMDWESAEHMIDYYSSYKYGFVINFNMNPVAPGKGSAIFFHIGTSPTVGCVAVSENMMLEYLKALDATQNPYILIM